MQGDGLRTMSKPPKLNKCTLARQLCLHLPVIMKARSEKLNNGIHIMHFMQLMASNPVTITMLTLKGLITYRMATR